MGCYERWVVPRLIDLGMRHPTLAGLRQRLVPLAHGRVLEIGVGSGLNLPHYGRAAQEVIGLDPSPQLLAKASRRARWIRQPIRLLEGVAEDVPLPDESVDTAVSTWTMCSVADPARVLAELRRVLRPGGRLLFLEHGRAEAPAVRSWQDRVDPVWTRLAGGCHLNRSIDRLIAAAGFRLGPLETGHLVRGPRIFTYHYCGAAEA
jgi:ubiquinone/menaquinone biosynthesis C-methylase UbiE